MKWIALIAVVLVGGVGEQSASSEPATDGPWLTLGTVVLCREAILSADVVEVPSPALAITITEEARQAVERETATLVGEPIQVVLGDVPLYETTVLEPIMGANHLLAARSEDEALSMEAATQTPCPR
jgi:hypothetical protein